MKKYSVIWALLLIASIIMVFVSEQLSPDLRITVMKEGGWIETASWGCYFAGRIPAPDSNAQIAESVVFNGDDSGAGDAGTRL